MRAIRAVPIVGLLVVASVLAWQASASWEATFALWPAIAAIERLARGDRGR